MKFFHPSSLVPIALVIGFASSTLASPVCPQGLCPVLPDPHVNGSYSANIFRIANDFRSVLGPEDNGSVTLTDFFFDTATAGATIKLIGVPSVSVTASSDGVAASSSATLSLNYWVEVVGPQGVVPVQYIDNGNVSTSRPGTRAFGSIDISGPIDVNGDGVFEDPLIHRTMLSQDGFAAGAFADLLKINDQFYAKTDDLIAVDLFVSVNTGGSPDRSTAAAYLDPYFYIDPTFPNANLYSIVTSPGVGNSLSSTPLPATLPLFATGLAGLGWLARRRRKQAT